LATQVLVRVFHQLPVDKPQKSKWSDDTKNPEITLWNRKKSNVVEENLGKVVAAPEKNDRIAAQSHEKLP